MGNYFVIFETIQPLHWSNNLDIKVVSCSGRGERLGHEIKTRRPLVEGREGGYQIPVPSLNLAQIPVPG